MCSCVQRYFNQLGGEIKAILEEVLHTEKKYVLSQFGVSLKGRFLS